MAQGYRLELWDGSHVGSSHKHKLLLLVLYEGTTFKEYLPMPPVKRKHFQDFLSKRAVAVHSERKAEIVLTLFDLNIPTDLVRIVHGYMMKPNRMRIRGPGILRPRVTVIIN